MAQEVRGHWSSLVVFPLAFRKHRTTAGVQGRRPGLKGQGLLFFFYGKK
jgi:hypothetical protein